MDKSFQAVANTYKVAVKLSHQQEVMRLYRHALRNIVSWAESRDVLNATATKIRAEFDANKHWPVDSVQTRTLLKDAHQRLAEQTHPDPVIQSYMPGGTLFMRNPAPPLEALFPDGIPEGISRRRLNIDMSNVPDDQEFGDPVLVDPANKKYWIGK
jgi:NADH dehydrogenase (ubiquinone) 1 beta subcomplex subunit 9